MRTSPPKTPLLAFLRKLTREERLQVAAWAETSVSYLYALGCCSRCNARSDLAKRIADASERMKRKKNGRVAAVTMEQLATMCERAE